MISKNRTSRIDSMPIGDVEILLKALENIAKYGDTGDYAMDAIIKYRYSMPKIKENKNGK